MDARSSAAHAVDPSDRASRRLWPLLAATLGAIFLLAACASQEAPTAALTTSDPEALSLATGAQRAQGAGAFATIRDLNVRYGSRWNALGSRSHAGLWDRRHRRESEEALDLGSGMTVQLHKGPGGRKFVLRAPGRVTVWFNGQPDSREEELRIAALIADIEKMELLGALYFQRPGIIFEKLEPARVDGAQCEQVHAILRPGFGYADEDHAVLAIDSTTQLLRRATVTLGGLKGGGKTKMEITFTNWGERSGVKWPIEFDERIPGMLPFNARHATLLDLKANHGFAPHHPELLGEAAGAVSSQVR